MSVVSGPCIQGRQYHFVTRDSVVDLIPNRSPMAMLGRSRLTGTGQTRPSCRHDVRLIERGHAVSMAGRVFCWIRCDEARQPPRRQFRRPAAPLLLARERRFARATNGD